MTTQLLGDNRPMPFEVVTVAFRDLTKAPIAASPRDLLIHTALATYGWRFIVSWNLNGSGYYIFGRKLKFLLISHNGLSNANNQFLSVAALQICQ